MQVRKNATRASWHLLFFASYTDAFRLVTSPPHRYFVPRGVERALNDMREAAARLDRGNDGGGGGDGVVDDGMEIVPVSPGETVCVWERRMKAKKGNPESSRPPATEGLFLTPFEVDHIEDDPGTQHCLAQGYILSSRHKEKTLKP